MSEQQIIDMIIKWSEGATDNLADGVRFKEVAKEIIKTQQQFPATKEIVLPDEGIDLYKEITDIFYHLVDRKDLSRADAEDMILKLFEVHGIKWRTEK